MAAKAKTYKRRDVVLFQTSGRNGLVPPRLGKIVKSEETERGIFWVVKADDDHREYRVRECNVHPGVK